MRHPSARDLRPLHTCALSTLIALAGLLVACERETPLEDPPPVELDADALPDCPASLATYFDRGAMQPPWRDTGYDAGPEREVGAAFAQAFALGVDGDFEGMVRLLDEQARVPDPHRRGETRPAFSVCQDREVGAVLFRPPMASGLPVMAWRPHVARGVIVEAPHPWFETDTLTQGLEAFLEHDARALVVSGAHRCASAEEVVCSGRTSVCGEAGAYRESDPAHNPESVFHAMHVALSEAYRSHAVVSLHGVSHHEMVVSDGTELGADGQQLIGATALELEALLEGHAGVMSCNGVPGMVPSDRFCGTTNVQGRHLNGVDDICLDAAGDSRQRFVHLEQPRYVRTTPALRRAVVARVFDLLDPHAHEG